MNIKKAIDQVFEYSISLSSTELVKAYVKCLCDLVYEIDVSVGMEARSDKNA